MPSSHLCLDVTASSDNCPQLKEKMSSSVLEHALKVRKPYTITKQREKWTEEEHNKFLEALKMYGRAWRQIEEHVGTKTTVQIRSHAQKFFTKVVRESAGDSTGEAKAMEIPPPRPKRKPAHPYPRKLGNLPSGRVAEKQEWSLIQELHVSEQRATEKDNPSEPKLSVHEQHNLSPASVLSAVGSSASELVNCCTSPESLAVGSENGCQSATTSVETDDKFLALQNSNTELDLGSDDSVSGVERTPVEAPAACLKLFGKMVWSTVGNAERCPEPHTASASFESHCKSDDIGQQGREQTLPSGEHNGQLNSWPSGMTPMFHLLPSPASLQSSAEAGAVHLPWMWAFYRPISLNSEQDQLPSLRDEISSADSNTVSASSVDASNGDGCTNGIGRQHCVMKFRRSETSAFRSLKATSDKPAKGFMPYSMCAGERSRR